MSDLAKRLINDAATLVRDWDITRELEREAADEIERLRAVVDAVDYLYECWRESGDSADWGNALPNLFEKRAALEGR